MALPSASASSGGAGSSGASFNLVPVPVSPTPLNIEADFQNAIDEDNFAEKHAAMADQYVQALIDLSKNLIPQEVKVDLPTATLTPTVVSPAPPVIGPITFTPPGVPTPFTGTLALTDTFPEFTAQAPSLLFPGAPSPIDVPDVPTPSVNLNYTYPDVSVDLPSTPQLLSINVKPFDGVNFPQFDADAPVLNLSTPQVLPYVAGAPYTDALLQTLQSTMRDRLATGVNGRNTGLPAPIEDNIWNRGREREIRSAMNSVANLDKMQDMGYSLPPSAWLDARLKIETDLNYTLAGQSRDVATEQAKLEQTNIQKAIDTTLTLESKLLDIANLAEQRQFDSWRYQLDGSIQIYNAGVQGYAARVQAYKAFVEAYTAQIEGQKALVQVYTAQVEAEKVKAEVNTALIAQYKTQVEAALSTIEVFKAEIQVIQARADVEKLKVEIYGEQVKAQVAKINIFSAEVEAYKAQISAEQTKEQVYATQAQTYGSLVDATYKTITSKVDVFKAQLVAKQQEFDGYKAQVEAAAENVKAQAAANTATADIYRSLVQGTSAYNDAVVKEWTGVITAQTEIAKVAAQVAKANADLHISAASIATDAAKVGATVESQLAASALGRVTYATHRSRQDSVSWNNGRSNSSSYSSSLSSSDSTSDNTSTSDTRSTNTSSSVSVSESTVHQINSVQ